MKVVYIKGDYKSVVKLLGLPPSFYVPQTKESYDTQVALDSDRTCYALVHPYTVSDVQASLRDSSDLYDEKEARLFDQQKALSYTQGNYDGSSLVAYRFSEKFIDARLNASENGWPQPHAEIRMNYIDDAGRENGCCIFGVRDDTKLDIAVEQRNAHFWVVVIEDVKSAPIDRTVHIFAHPHLLPDNLQLILKAGLHSKLFQGVLAEIVPELFHRAMNSKALSQEVLADLFQGAYVSLPHIEAIDARLLAGKNIDDRDLKLAKLYQILREVVLDASMNKWVKRKSIADIAALIKIASQDINFFKSVEIEELEKLQQNISESHLLKSLEFQLPEAAISRLLAEGNALQKNVEKIEKKHIKELNKLHVPDLDYALSQMYVSRNRWDFLRLAVALGSAKLNPLVGLVAVASQVNEMRDKEAKLEKYQELLQTGSEESENKLHKNITKQHRLFNKRVQQILDLRQVGQVEEPEMLCSSISRALSFASSDALEARGESSSSNQLSSSRYRLFSLSDSLSPRWETQAEEEKSSHSEGMKKTSGSNPGSSSS